MPSMPQIMPPVGKSGPLTSFIRSATVMAGLSICAQTPSMISPRLCGGMFVAIPTAMPARMAANLGAFHVLAAWEDRELLHRVEDASLAGFQAIPHVRKRAGDDDGHRVVEERVLDLVGDVDLGDFLVRGVERRVAGR